MRNILRRLWNFLRRTHEEENEELFCPFCGTPAFPPVLDALKRGRANVGFVGCCARMQRALYSISQRKVSSKYSLPPG